jgi:dihydrofolate synthase/folylpolyglutamate synthase
MSFATGQSVYDEAVDFLHSRIDYERAAVVPYGVRDFKLDRMRDLLRRLGDPLRRYPVIHVAGTKGKGSTSAMIASMLSAAGYRTGLYTSPHLHGVEERMRVDGVAASREEVAALVARVRTVVEELDGEGAADFPPGLGPTYFEITTAMAALHFAYRGVDAAVLEVGLGGRLDSTNVCEPSVTVITTISFDHMRQLGNTLSAIAWEKAGIIKPGVPAVSGVVDNEPQRVIEQVCAERGSPLVQLGRDFEFDYRPPRGLETANALGELDFRYHVPGREHEWSGLRLGLPGRHQGANAAVALAVAAELRRQEWRLPEAAVQRGLAEVAWPARIEVVSRRPTLVIDAAHNVASAAALTETMDESFAARRRMLVFATTRDKDARGMLALLAPRFDTVLLTRYANNPRGMPVDELAAMVEEPHKSRVVVCDDTAAAWDEAHRRAAADDLVCIAGSFFLAAEMREHVNRRPLSRS